MKIVQRSTPNFTPGRTQRVTKLIIHWIVGDLAAADATFKNRESNVSAHYGIENDTIYRWVPENATAWHCAGYVNGQLVTANPFSIGIEHSAAPGRPASAKTYETSINLCADICRRYGLSEQAIEPHNKYVPTQCLPLDVTELLTPNGWVPLGGVKIGDVVAQWDNGKIEFTEVTDVIEPYQAKVVKRRKFEATEDHRVVYHTQTKKDEWKWANYVELLGRRGAVYLPIAGDYEAQGLDIDDDLLRFVVWVQADGHYMFDNGSYYGVEFHFRKQRKVDSVMDVATALGLEPKLEGRKDGTQAIRIYGSWVVSWCEEWLNDKQFDWNLLEMNRHQYQVFKSELLLADGCVANQSYSSSKMANIDVVQAIMAFNDNGSHVYDNGISPRLFFGPKAYTVSHKSITTERETTVGCVAVKSGAIVIRQHGQTIVTGNCPGTMDLNRIRKGVKAKLQGGDMATPKLISLAFMTAFNRPATAKELRDYADASAEHLLQSVYNNNRGFRTKAANFENAEEALKIAYRQLTELRRKGGSDLLRLLSEQDRKELEEALPVIEKILNIK